MEEPASIFVMYSMFWGERKDKGSKEKGRTEGNTYSFT